MRRYAEDTAVPVGRTRASIDELLRAWGCSKIGWIDDFEAGLAQLQFQWSRDGQVYLARFSVQLPDDAQIRERSRHESTGAFLPSKYERLKQATGRHEHRVLLLWLKAALNAVEAGIIEASLVFLPFLVTRDGRTLGDHAIEKFPTILAGDPSRLLPAARREGGEE